MNFKIRKEEPEDFRIVENITREAFWNLYKPGCNEHFLVHNLRNHPDFIPELSFVIEVDGKIVGSIFYSHSKIIDKYGTEFKTITFGPVSIIPSMHRKGLGRALISYSIDEAKKLGNRAIIIGGYPHHYNIHGFVGTKKYNIAMPDNSYYTGIMALPLYVDALAGIKSGVVFFSEAMEPNEESLDEFEKQFESKEKKITQSQIDFEKAVSEIDSNDYEN